MIGLEQQEQKSRKQEVKGIRIYFRDTYETNNHWMLVYASFPTEKNYF